MSAVHRIVRAAFALLASIAIPASAATVRVKMTDAPPYYHPPTVEVRTGDTVEWSNSGPALQHVLTTEDGMFFSDDVSVGKTWSHTFDRAGVYTYICFRHFFMKGTVVVRNEDGSTVAPPATPYEKAFREFVVPTRLAIPRMIIASRHDDAMWFTEGGGDFYGFEDIPPQNKIARIDDSGRIVEYATPTPDGDGSKVGVDSLVMDRQNNIWFTERISNRIGRLAPDGTIREYPIPTKDGYALGVDLDSKGNIWFAERYGNRLGWMTPDGAMEEIDLPDKDSEPRTVFVDSKDRVWYTAREANQIGYWDHGKRQLYRLQIPTKLARPAGICETRDGTIWFVEMVGNKLAKIQGEQIVEYPIPSKFAAPFKCAVDAKGDLWFTLVFANAIARFDAKSETITEYTIPTPDSRPGGIAIDRKGRVWFTMQKANKIGMFDPALAEKLIAASKPAPPAPPTPTSAIEDFRIPTPGGGPGNDLIDDGAGRLWFTEVFGNKVASLDLQSGAFHEIDLKTPVSMPVGLARDASGVFWVSLFRGNGVARVDPRNGAVEEFAMPTEAALPAGIAIDEKGDIWIAQLAANRIARFDRNAKRFEEIELPGEDNGPLQIVADQRGSLWITASEETGNALLRFDLAKRTFRSHKLPTPNAAPVGMLVDGDSVWVAEGGAARIARFHVPSESWEELPIPGDKAEPVKLARDARGRIWITDGGGLGSAGGNRLLVFDPTTKQFTSIEMKTRGAKPMGVVAASDGHIWFTQQGANRVSRIRLTGGDHAQHF
jgi:streptogramin lyase/plastocyanin